MPFEYQVSDEIAIAIPNPKRDAEPLYKLVESSRKELGPWLPWANKMSSAKDELDFFGGSLSPCRRREVAKFGAAISKSTGGDDQL